MIVGELSMWKVSIAFQMSLCICINGSKNLMAQFPVVLYCAFSWIFKTHRSSIHIGAVQFFWFFSRQCFKNPKSSIGAHCTAIFWWEYTNLFWSECACAEQGLSGRWKKWLIPSLIVVNFRYQYRIQLYNVRKGSNVSKECFVTFCVPKRTTCPFKWESFSIAHAHFVFSFLQPEEPTRDAFAASSCFV